MRWHLKSILFFILNSNILSAGGISHGGGDVISCPFNIDTMLLASLNTDFDYSAKYLSDIFGIYTSHHLSKQRKDLNPDIVFSTALKINEEEDPVGFTQIHYFLKMMPFEKWNFVTEIQELEDDDIQDLPNGCKKEQLAIQSYEEGKLPSLTVHRHRFAHISEIEQKFFPLHEAHIFAKLSQNIKGNTNSIRERIKDLFTKAIKRASGGESLSETETWRLSRRANEIAATWIYQVSSPTLEANIQALRILRGESIKTNKREKFVLLRNLYLKSALPISANTVEKLSESFVFSIENHGYTFSSHTRLEFKNAVKETLLKKNATTEDLSILITRFTNNP